MKRQYIGWGTQQCISNHIYVTLTKPCVSVARASAVITWTKSHPLVHGLVQKRRNSSAYALELRLFCTDPLTPGTCCCQFWSCWCPGANPSIQGYPQVIISILHMSTLTCHSLQILTLSIVSLFIYHTTLDPLIPSPENRADRHTIKTPRHSHPMYAYTSLFANFIEVRLYSIQNCFKYINWVCFSYKSQYTSGSFGFVTWHHLGMMTLQ